MLMANATAILTDAFPVHQRGTALGINQVAAIAGSFLGLVIGGVLSEWHWRAVFWVSVPFGVVGAIWSYLSLHEVGARHKGKLDLPGQPHLRPRPRPAAHRGRHLRHAALRRLTRWAGRTRGWSAALVGGRRPARALRGGRVDGRRPDVPPVAVRDPRVLARQPRRPPGVDLARWTAVHPHHLAAGHLAPPRGYSYESTPLWASIFLLPLTVGFLAAGPAVGLPQRPLRRASVRRRRAPLVTAVSFLGLMLLPVDFAYPAFAFLTFLNGVGSGMFSSPNASRDHELRARRRSAASRRACA